MSVISVSMKQPFGSLNVGLKETTCEEHYIVKLSADGASAKAEAVGATGIPAIGAAYHTALAGVPRPLLRSKTASYLADSSGIYYLVTCSYSNSSSTAAEAAQTNKAPWQMPWTFSYGHTQYERPLTTDYSDDEKPVLNSAGDPFDPPVANPLARPKITVKRAVVAADVLHGATDLINSCNSETETVDGVSYGVGELRLLDVSETKSYWEDPQHAGVYIAYYEQEITIEGAASEEDSLATVEVLDAGYRVKDGTKVQRDVDASGAANPGLCRLDGSGAKITDPATPSVYLTFQAFPKLSWGALDLA